MFYDSLCISRNDTRLIFIIVAVALAFGMGERVEERSFTYDSYHILNSVILNE